MIDELLAAAKKVCDEAKKVCDELDGDCTVEMSGLLGLLGDLRDEIKKAGGDAKKTVVVNLGNIRDDTWETTAVLGLELMKQLREAGFDPHTESPYVSEYDMDEDWYSLGLGEDGDIPLLIVVEIDEEEKFAKLFSIVGERASVHVLGESEEDNYEALEAELEHELGYIGADGGDLEELDDLDDEDDKED